MKVKLLLITVVATSMLSVGCSKNEHTPTPAKVTPKKITLSDGTIVTNMDYSRVKITKEMLDQEINLDGTGVNFDQEGIESYYKIEKCSDDFIKMTEKVNKRFEKISYILGRYINNEPLVEYGRSGDNEFTIDEAKLTKMNEELFSDLEIIKKTYAPNEKGAVVCEVYDTLKQKIVNTEENPEFLYAGALFTNMLSSLKAKHAKLEADKTLDIDNNHKSILSTVVEEDESVLNDEKVKGEEAARNARIAAEKAKEEAAAKAEAAEEKRKKDIKIFKRNGGV